MKRVTLVWIICAALGAALLLSAKQSRQPSPEMGEHSSGTALIHSDFTLQSADGKTVTGKDFEGKYLLVFFGFTHCPDICPTTLGLLHQTYEKLGDAAKDFNTVLITVDPQRDTPAVTDQYAKKFDARFIGLSGTPEQLKAAQDAFKAYSSGVPEEARHAEEQHEHAHDHAAMDYQVDHSGFIYLMGKKGEYLTHFRPESTPEELAAELQKTAAGK